jgi:hypothetical protein
MPGDAVTPISERLIRDPRVSLKAVGMFALLASLRDDESVSPEFLASHSPDGVSAVKSALRELIRFGYVSRIRGRRADGTILPVEYFISDLGEAQPVGGHRQNAAHNGRALSEYGWAYAIAGRPAAHVKIGCSGNPKARLRGLQTGWPHPLELLWTAPGGAALEAHLHAHFAGRHMRGEWFDFAGADAVELIAAAAESFAGSRR